ADRIVADSIEAGFITRRSDRRLLLHPLLRSFLRMTGSDGQESELQRAAHEIGAFYVDAGRWDDAFTVAQELKDPQSLEALLERALESLVSAGRLATLEQWVVYADEQSVDSPLIQL